MVLQRNEVSFPSSGCLQIAEFGTGILERIDDRQVRHTPFHQFLEAFQVEDRLGQRPTARAADQLALVQCAVCHGEGVLIPAPVDGGIFVYVSECELGKAVVAFHGSVQKVGYEIGQFATQILDDRTEWYPRKVRGPFHFQAGYAILRCKGETQLLTHIAEIQHQLVPAADDQAGVDLQFPTLVVPAGQPIRFMFAQEILQAPVVAKDKGLVFGARNDGADVAKLALAVLVQAHGNGVLRIRQNRDAGRNPVSLTILCRRLPFGRHRHFQSFAVQGHRQAAIGRDREVDRRIV